MLVTLDDAKTFIGEEGVDYDDYLTQQIQMISDAIEGYCSRSFESRIWIQTWHRNDFDFLTKKLPVYHFPVKELTFFKEADTEAALAGVDPIPTGEYRLHKPTGFVTRDCGRVISDYRVFQMKYTAGYDVIPSTIQHVVFSLILEAYNRKKSGVALSFGSDIQSIAIPGVISVQFDYTLSANERVNTYGTILGSYLNVLDPWRSDRAITGNGTLEYVEEEAP